MDVRVAMCGMKTELAVEFLCDLGVPALRTLRLRALDRRENPPNSPSDQT
jgi:hypothetical protein